MIIPQENSIKFIKLDGLLPGLDNTLTRDLRIFNGLTYDDHYVFISSETKIVQVLGTSNETIEMKVVLNDGTEINVDGNVVASFPSSDRKYWEFPIDMSDESYTECFSLKAISDDDDEVDWISETINIVEYEAEMLKLEWYSNLNTNVFYYGSGTVNSMWLTDDLYNGYAPEGRDIVFDNDEELKKIDATLFRTLALRLGEMSPTKAEKLAMACKSAFLFVNDVEFTAEDNMDVTNLDKTNLNDAEIILTQVNIIGYTTHKVGFNINGIMSLDAMQFGGADLSGSDEFPILEGYMAHAIEIYHEAGVLVNIKFGITPGGNEIGEKIVDAANPVAILQIHSEIAKSGIASIYYTITGVGGIVSIYGHSLRNRLPS